MSTVARNIENCRHLWWLGLRTDGAVIVRCERCEASDQEAFNQEVVHLITLDVGDTHVSGGHHDYDGSGWIPVNLYVTQSRSYNFQKRFFEQRASVTVTPRELPPIPNTIDGQLLDSSIEEIEANTEELLAAIDRQEEQQGTGTGWCAPSA